MRRIPPSFGAHSPSPQRRRLLHRSGFRLIHLLQLRVPVPDYPLFVFNIRRRHFYLSDKAMIDHYLVTLVFAAPRGDYSVSYHQVYSDWRNIQCIIVDMMPCLQFALSSERRLRQVQLVPHIR